MRASTVRFQLAGIALVAVAFCACGGSNGGGVDGAAGGATGSGGKGGSGGATGAGGATTAVGGRGGNGDGGSAGHGGNGGIGGTGSAAGGFRQRGIGGQEPVARTGRSRTIRAPRGPAGTTTGAGGTGGGGHGGAGGRAGAGGGGGGVVMDSGTAGSQLQDCAGLICGSNQQVVNVRMPALGPTQCACLPVPTGGQCTDCTCGEPLCVQYGGHCSGVHGRGRAHVLPERLTADANPAPRTSARRRRRKICAGPR